MQLQPPDTSPACCGLNVTSIEQKAPGDSVMPVAQAVLITNAGAVAGWAFTPVNVNGASPQLVTTEVMRVLLSTARWPKVSTSSLMQILG